MLDYIMNMLEYICSGDNEEDKRNMQLLADSILERSLELHRQQMALNVHNYSLSSQQDQQETTEKEELKDDALHRLSHHVSEGTKPPTKDEIVLYLQVLREFYMQQRYGEGKLHDLIIADMGKNMYSTGLMYFNITGLMTNSQLAA